MATGNDIRKGMAINYQGELCLVLETQHRTPGNKRAFVQMSLRNLRTGNSSDVRFSSTERIEVIPLHSKKMEYSYQDGDDYVFSDPDTYETVTLNRSLVGNLKDYLIENETCTITFVDDRAIAFELPPSVILTVKEAPEGIKGDSTSNVQKTITLETGIDIQAPLFIKTGEKIRVDTRSGKYLERA